jgi:uncharacterized membrane protein (DUF2068 family)
VRRTSKQPDRAGPDRIIWLIAAFKFVKGALLVAVGVGALSLLHENVGAAVTHWIAVLRVDPDNRFIHALLRRLLTVNDQKLVTLSVGTFFYAALMLTEGLGLALRKRWAEYFTIFATGSFIPLELYELYEHFSVLKIIVIAVNVAVVWYLVRRVRQRKQRR